MASYFILCPPPCSACLPDYTGVLPVPPHSSLFICREGRDVNFISNEESVYIFRAEQKADLSNRAVD